MAVYDSSPIPFRFDPALPGKLTVTVDRTLYIGATIRGDIIGESMDFRVIEITASYAGVRAKVVPEFYAAGTLPHAYFVEWDI